jgi:hypothetical protein
MDYGPLSRFSTSLSLSSSGLQRTVNSQTSPLLPAQSPFRQLQRAPSKPSRSTRRMHVEGLDNRTHRETIGALGLGSYRK